MYYLALCCIAKDEDLYLKEWLTYHALIGVEHFYIYDNMSRTPIQELLQDFADSSRVTVRRVSGKAIQRTAYQDCLETFGPSCVWLGFIDVDEFICLREGNDLRALLPEFEQYGGLSIPWDIFSSSGHDARPDGPLIKNYTQRMSQFPSNIHHKSIIRPCRTESNFTPHTFRYKPENFCVSEDHYPIPGDSPFTFSMRRRLKINHYYYRSRQDFEEKIKRGRADTGTTAGRSMDRFDAHLTTFQEKDTTILRFLPALEKALKAGTLPVTPLYLPHGEPYFKYMDAALAFSEASQFEKAAVCLARAIPEHAGHADLWIMRALIARLSRQYDRAERFIFQALRLEESPNSYLELIALRKAQKRYDEAEALQRFLRALVTLKVNRTE
ncbi:glycosyltransferase family 92 protein [Desulfovibrio sp. OttesenSCG-928-I05]|nr:glycosyltransferase family 92 protein [Desulfovibrio sp. OttesenSCG-928-I05]